MTYCLTIPFRSTAEGGTHETLNDSEVTLELSTLVGGEAGAKVVKIKS